MAHLGRLCPGLAAFMARMRARPAVASVLAEDVRHYREERAAM